jgi:hypothetical protein
MARELRQSHHHTGDLRLSLNKHTAPGDSSIHKPLPLQAKQTFVRQAISGGGQEVFMCSY